eukprot:Seg788.20 transcript_id=Seg788.20/GoldUCD/mRNA.D3Y31 product="tRNA-splicing endonuclease subunit Sen2" protein_id=Seg788.20/GoldUCD/D3Y31
MAESEELRRLRPKRGSGNVPREAPFPVPIADITGKPASEKRWYRYFGTLKGDSVVVDRFGDMTFLYKMGFFGKGSLSKSSPKFSKFGNTFDERWKSQMMKQSGRKLTDEDLKAKEESFEEIHSERLRQHTEWSRQQQALEEDLPTKQVKLEDPYEIDEFLQLSPEEAFFLSFGLGCLTVKDENEKELTISEMWTRFCQLKPRFVETYATYHYFRSHGWVVRDGIVYGSDFLLYKDGMPFYHSSYAVFAYLAENGEIGAAEVSLPWNWQFLTCVNRVAEHVAKEVLISIVTKPQGFKEDELSSPRCLLRLQVQESLMRRWIPEKHRESKK